MEKSFHVALGLKLTTVVLRQKSGPTIVHIFRPTAALICEIPAVNNHNIINAKVCV